MDRRFVICQKARNCDHESEVKTATVSVYSVIHLYMMGADHDVGKLHPTSQVRYLMSCDMTMTAEGV